MSNVFYHSGSFGDIIYSIPFCLSTIGIYNFNDIKGSVNQYSLLLDLCCCHKPENNYQLALDNLRKVSDLLSIQPYIKSVYSDIKIDCQRDKVLDLSEFRNGKVNLLGGDISLRYCFLKRQLKYFDISQPWLIVPQSSEFDYFNNKIIIFRTNRYRNSKINFQFLKAYKNKLVYIGLLK